MARRFACTACGKCCSGQLPLTLRDARANAERFPLGFVWTPVRKGSRDFAAVAALGVTIPLPKRDELAVQLVIASILPQDFPCPALLPDRRCGIQESKPARCAAMPFTPFREERHQAELLTPRAGWECDTSEAAPVVWDAGRVLAREELERERRALREELPVLRQYAAWVLQHQPAILGQLQLVTAKGGHVLTSLSSFLTATRAPDAKALATQQLPVLEALALRTAGAPAHAALHEQYRGWAAEAAWLAQRPG